MITRREAFALIAVAFKGVAGVASAASLQKTTKAPAAPKDATVTLEIFGMT